MKYKNAHDRARQAHARTCVTRFAELAGWTFACLPELLPPVLRDHFYEPLAQLVLIPWAGGCLFGLEAAVRETRCTLLLVEPGATNTGLATTYFTVIAPVRGAIFRHAALRLWISADDPLFLVPDPDGDDPAGQCFSVGHRGVHAAAMPWSDPIEHGFGIGRADILMRVRDAPETR